MPERDASDAVRRPLPVLHWFTNIAAPYRVPVWEQLASRADLTVFLLESDRQRVREGRRPADWSDRGLRRLRHRTLHTLKLRRGETSLYTLLDPRFAFARKPSAVLLGGWESPAYWQLLFVAKLRRIRTVGFYESTLRTNRHRSGVIARARSLFMRNLDAIVVPGADAEDALRSFGVAAERIHRGFNAVDVQHIADRARSSRMNDQRSGGHRFVFVGQLISRKQPALLLQAFAKVREPEDELVFVGDGPERRTLEDRVRTLGLTGHVTFKGTTQNDAAIDEMIASDTLVLPSSEEVWGLVVNEGLAAGLHAVVTASSGVAASTKHMRGVYICDADEDSLAEALVVSRSNWRGHISDPEILEHTPAAFASVFLGALDQH
jgi:glycosyltransferase involved in cell wall biosynthesis